jgi:hypothetical protein
MSDISTIYANFSAIDYKDQNVLSSFALPITPLRFVTDFPQDTSTKIVWNFGDGTTSDTLTALKSYSFPGQYDVNLVVYDCYDNALISTFTKTITIYDYFPFTFNIQLSAGSGTYLQPFNFGMYFQPEGFTYFQPEVEVLELKNGKIHGPWKISSYYPPYQPVSSLFYRVSGSNSRNYWEIEHEKFNHLESFHTLYQKISNCGLSSHQFDEISRIDPIPTPIFAKVSGGTIVHTLSTDTSSFYIGTSAQKDVYFRDDAVSGDVNIKFFFDKNNNYLPKKYSNNPQKFINNFGITLSATIIENDEIEELSITSNGLDGEGYAIDSFNIANIKFFDTKIPFCIKIKDSDGFSIKNFEKISLSALNISVSGSSLSSWSYIIESLNYTLSAQNSGGSFRGYIGFTGTELLSNVTIEASGTFTNDLSSTFTLSGSSNTFNVYPEAYKIFKYHENFDAKETIKSLRFQETLLDKTMLFDEFIGTVLGDSDSDHQTIGKTTYEKIANFVQNIADVDTSEEEGLFSMVQMMGGEVNNNKNIPQGLQRATDLLSIGKNRLFGTGNKFRENFDIKGHSSKSVYGTNLGDQIDNATYIISAGIPIVALEKFSNQYTLLNTYQPLCAAGWNYQLSAYSPDWGWPLVLPSSFTPDQFEKYYLFFEYVEGYDDRTIGGVIDFGNTNTTLLSTTTYEELFGQWGIADNMISYTLYDSLSLFGS